MRKDTIYDEDEKKYKVYGIEAFNFKGKILQSFPDIFFDRQKAKRFVNLCNKNDLELTYLANVVKDLLEEQYAFDKLLHTVFCYCKYGLYQKLSQTFSNWLI